MKKYLVLLLCLFVWTSNSVFAGGNPIGLDLQIVDETPNHPGNSKAPMRMPRIYQDGYTLILSSSHPEYLINIMEGDEVVFSSVIPEGVAAFELPAYLSGEYTIQFVSGRFCFYGLINF